MITEKPSDSFAYPPRYMRSDRMAAYCSVSKSKFLDWVEDGKMPQPIPNLGGVTLFDRLDVEAAFDDLKMQHDLAPSRENTVHKLLRMQ